MLNLKEHNKQKLVGVDAALPTLVALFYTRTLQRKVLQKYTILYIVL